MACFGGPSPVGPTAHDISNFVQLLVSTDAETLCQTFRV